MTSQQIWNQLSSLIRHTHKSSLGCFSSVLASWTEYCKKVLTSLWSGALFYFSCVRDWLCSVNQFPCNYFIINSWHIIHYPFFFSNHLPFRGGCEQSWLTWTPSVSTRMLLLCISSPKGSNFTACSYISPVCSLTKDILTAEAEPRCSTVNTK